MEILFLLLAAAALYAAFGSGRKQRLFRPSGRREPYSGPKRTASTPQNAYPRPVPRSTPVLDSSDQLRVVMNASFEKTRLMSRSEYDVFRVVETHLRRCGPGYRLMAQTSMGEFIKSADPSAHSSINSKRVDMVVIDTFGFAVVAIEHQGTGHYQNDAAARDAVKREALRRAGIEYLEIFQHHQPEDICSLVSGAIERSRPPTAAAVPSPRADRD
ncbi:DUF2726 domain-containing protein [Devosia sp. CAU 1758]